MFNSITLHDILRQTPFHTCRLVDREIVRSPDRAHACAMTVFSWRIQYGLIDLQTKFKISMVWFAVFCWAAVVGWSLWLALKPEADLGIFGRCCWSGNSRVGLWSWRTPAAKERRSSLMIFFLFKIHEDAPMYEIGVGHSCRESRCTFHHCFGSHVRSSDCYYVHWCESLAWFRYGLEAEQVSLHHCRLSYWLSNFYCKDLKGVR